jgi:hypothetical protein
MSVYDQAVQAREGEYGLMVLEPAKVLPATGLASIFTVNVGPVLITSLTGLVTTACSATATTITIGATPTGGSSAPAVLATAGTGVASLPVGAYVAVAPFTGTATPAVLLQSPASGVMGGGIAAYTAAGAPLANGGIAVVSPGVITITTSATNTGAMSWTCSYVPLVVGASVTAV